MKTLAFDTPIDYAEELAARISVAAREILDKSGLFQNIRNAMRHRCEVCIAIGGRNLEHFI